MFSKISTKSCSSLEIKKEKENKMIDQLVKKKMSCVLGNTIRRDIDYKIDFKSERWIKTEYDDKLEETHML